MLKRIGAEEGGEFKAIASGTLPSGRPVIVNADGTVSSVSSSTASVGSSVVYSSTTNTGISASAFDSSNNKVVITYRDSSNNGKAVVGTVSGSSISFGTPVTYYSGTVNDEQGIVFDTNANKFVVIYSRGGTGKAIVGTVSGTSISFGSEAEFDNQQGTYIGITFDSTNNKVVVVYIGTNNYVETKVGTVSGTSISFGTAVVAMSLSPDQNAITFDSNRGKVVVCSRISTKGRAAVGTVSGTSISFASNVIFADNQTKYIAPTFDTTNNKVVIAFINGSSTDQGQAVVGDINSSGVISFGSAVTYNANIEEFQGIAFDSNANKVIIAYDSQGDTKGKVISGTVSGTSITFDSETEFASGGAEGVSVAFDSNANKNVIAYKDAGNANRGTGIVFAPGSTNLTSENYIGMSRGGVSQAQTIGSSVTFESAITQNIASIFDSSNNKVVITYQDGGNSSYGTAVVGDVSGSSISFGTPVVFESASNGVAALTFDSNSNKVVLAYHDSSNSDYGTSRVGTVSGTSISFGSAAVYESAVSYYNAIDFDSNLNKVVIAYRDQGNSNYGTAVVGTVSGTSISFGTPVVFNAGSVEDCSVIFDSSNNKTVILYKDTANSNYGTAIVGTVSGTSISFGSEVAFNSAATTYPIGIFDPSSSKIVIAFRDEGDSNNGKVMVGTVSGTSISFGSEVLYASGITGNGSGIAYDSENNQIILVYQDATNGTVKTGTVSGSTVTLSSAVEFNSVDSTFNRVVFDSNSKVSVISYTDDDNSKYGKALVFKQDIRGQVADGGNASMDIIGSVSTNQSGLTAGQQYFVQTDGTISTTADSPSVLAGTAISATELVVKT